MLKGCGMTTQRQSDCAPTVDTATLKTKGTYSYMWSIWHCAAHGHTGIYVHT